MRISTLCFGIGYYGIFVKDKPCKIWHLEGVNSIDKILNFILNEKTTLTLLFLLSLTGCS
jgi:hypothetical protein